MTGSVVRVTVCGVTDLAADAALGALIAALERSEAMARAGVERAREIQRLRRNGFAWRQVLATEERPLLSDTLFREMAIMNEIIGRLRREEARQLHSEGARPEEIADLFGISVEHVEAMLA